METEEACDTRVVADKLESEAKQKTVKNIKLNRLRTWSTESRAAKKAGFIKCFDLWANGLAEVVVDDILRYSDHDPVTTWAIGRPYMLPGQKRADAIAAMNGLKRKISDLLRRNSEQGIAVRCLDVNDDAAV